MLEFVEIETKQFISKAKKSEKSVIILIFSKIPLKNNYCYQRFLFMKLKISEGVTKSYPSIFLEYNSYELKLLDFREKIPTF